MRSWLVIPAMGAVAAVAALVLGAPPSVGELERGRQVADAIAAALAGAALAGAVRALAGGVPRSDAASSIGSPRTPRPDGAGRPARTRGSAAALAGAVIAPLLAVVLIAERGGGLAAPCTALAAIAWTVAELARPPSRPLVALVPAAIAAVAAPAAAALVAIAGLRLVVEPGPRASPRVALAAVLAGAAAIVLAIAAGVAQHSGFAELWFGAAARPIAPAVLAARAADALGPIIALAALAGLAGLAVAARHRLAELAVAACAAGALLTDLRAGAIGPLTLGLAALTAGLAAGRFAGQIRLPAGQALAGATIGLLLLLPPAWTAAEGHRGAGASR